jgi:hypothetical protein
LILINICLQYQKFIKANHYEPFYGYRGHLGLTPKEADVFSKFIDGLFAIGATMLAMAGAALFFPFTWGPGIFGRSARSMKLQTYQNPAEESSTSAENNSNYFDNLKHISTDDGSWNAYDCVKRVTCELRNAEPGFAQSLGRY